MILINGSNFIDGLNGLLLGYFLLIIFILLSHQEYVIDINNDASLFNTFNNLHSNFIFFKYF